MEKTTIQIDNKVREKLESYREYNRETWNEILNRILLKKVFPKVDYESLFATIEVLQDSECMRSIAESMERINSGDYGISIDEVEKELGLK